MKTTINSLLIDTNVWIDYFIAERPHHDEAFELIDLAASNGIALCYAITTAKDLFHQLAVDAKRWARRRCGGSLPEGFGAAAQEFSWGCVTSLDNLATPLGMDGSDLWLAVKQKPVHRDLEDNLVAAAAKRARVDFLVTGDADFKMHSPVATLLPGDAVRLLRA